LVKSDFGVPALHHEGFVFVVHITAFAGMVSAFEERIIFLMPCTPP